MTSGFSGDMFYGSGTTNTGTGPGSGPVPGRANSLTTLPGFQQQQQQQRSSMSSLQQQGVGMLSSMNQIAQRRAADLLIGKRTFGDYQQVYQQQLLQQQQQNSLLLLQQRQQQQQGLAYFQQQQQQSYLMRSVKQRTLSSSPIFPNTTTTTNSLPSPSPRFGVPIYGQLRQHNHHHHHQQQIFNNVNIDNNNNNNINNHFLNNNNNQFNPANNCLIPNLSSTPTNNNINNNTLIQAQSPALSATLGYSNLGPNFVQPKPEPQPDNNANFGYSNPVVSMVAPKVELDSEDHKILDTLHELEKQLLNDDDDDDNNHDENDAVSVITNSEWSETFQNLMSPNANPGPSPGPVLNNACSSTSGSSNTNTIPTSNNMISPSPTSSTSSCCSTSVPHQQPPPPPPQQQPETLSVKELVSEAANAISEGKTEVASELLARLARVSDSKGNSDQRLGFYLGNALRSRVFPGQNPAPVLELYSEDQMQAMYALYDISPCFKFGLLAANLVMLEAITTALQEGIKVHVIDFDVGQGAQYTNLLRALAERRSQVGGCSNNVVACELKVTVVETELENRRVIESVREGLVKLAERVGIKLKFQGLTRKITELTRESLGCEESEAIVVNFAFKLHRVPDESVSMENLRDELLRRVKGLNPRAVTLVEQEMNGNTAPFVTRVNEACVYYGALFDSLESTLPREHLDRVRVEEGLGRKMANAVACEGRERVERAEVFGKWKARMGMAGFELKPLSSSVAESMRAKLNSARGGNPGFTVKEESGGVGFGWVGRTLTVASAWR